MLFILTHLIPSEENQRKMFCPVYIEAKLSLIKLGRGENLIYAIVFFFLILSPIRPCKTCLSRCQERYMEACECLCTVSTLSLMAKLLPSQYREQNLSCAPRQRTSSGR